jgi:CNT family concentrative nucleoside transporter
MSSPGWAGLGGCRVLGARRARRALCTWGGVVVGMLVLWSVVPQRARAESPQGSTAAPVDASAEAVGSDERAERKGAIEPLSPSSRATTTTTTTSAEPQKPRALSLRIAAETTWTERLRCLLGTMVLLGVAFILSEDRRRIPWRLVCWGTGLQVTFALLVLKTQLGLAVFAKANDAVDALLSFSTQGARFVFGNLVDMSVPVGPTIGQPSAMSVVLEPTSWAWTGAFMAFQVLPTILFFSALMALLYHLGVMQIVVRAIASVMQRTMGTSGAETTSVASNIFLGQTEAPLLVKPYLSSMTRSELMAVMVAGFATVAGGVMAAYVGMLRQTFPDIAGHLLACSVMGAPASLVMAKMMVPETSAPTTAGRSGIALPRVDTSALDALTRGTSEGLLLAFNVGAMLITFLGLIALVNAGFVAVGDWFGQEGFSLERLMGFVGAPLAFAMGVPWDDCDVVGGLIATKTVVNEFVAYQQLAGILNGQSSLQLHHPLSVLIATYALCGFANFGSIGIQIGGIAAMCPDRRGDVARLGMKAMVCGSLATFQTATIAAMIS